MRSMKFISGIVVLLCMLFLVSSSLPAQEKPLVKIGFIGPLTGGNAAVGIGAKNSFELRVNEILSAGDYPYRVEVVYEDDASDPATGVAAANKLCADPALLAAATHWNSPVGLATVHIFNRFGVAQLFWGTIHSDIIYGNDYTTKTRPIPTSKQSMELAGEWVVEKFGLKNWVIIYDTTDYGTKLRSEFTEALESRGGKVLEAIGITAGQQDFGAVLGRVRGLRPEGIFYGGVLPDGGAVRRQAVRLGLANAMFLGAPGIQSDTFGEITGSSGEGAFCSGTFDPRNSPEGRAFIERYSAKYSQPYEQNGPYAYDSAGIILEAVRAVGPDRAKVADYIWNNSFSGIIGAIKWDSHGQNITGGLNMYVNQDGKWTRYEESEYATGKRKLPWK